MLKDARNSTDELCDWLKANGYNVSRSAVGRYRQAVAAPVLFPGRTTIWGRSDTDRRRTIRWLAGKIDGADLHALSLFASFLATNAASGRGRRPRVRRGGV